MEKRGSLSSQLDVVQASANLWRGPLGCFASWDSGHGGSSHGTSHYSTNGKVERLGGAGQALINPPQGPHSQRPVWPLRHASSDLGPPS
jgi:hypothetical protein